MRILFLSPRQCWPPHGGAKIREYHFLRMLCDLGDVTYAHFTDPGSSPLTRHDLPFVAEIIAVPKPRAYGPLQALRGIAGQLPLSVLNYISPEMMSSLKRLADSGSFDVVNFDSIHMWPYSTTLSGKVVYNWHNIESEAMLRYSETAASPARRWYASLTARKLAALERKILPQAFGHLVCSERERCELLRIEPRAQVAVIENGVDCSFFTPMAARSPDSIVFVARLENVANSLAAIHFAKRIWPGIRQQFPALRLVLVGANPRPSVRGLANVLGVEVTGTVEDVRPYYSDAVAAIVPLLSGSGTRLKILEAMAARVPVISTPVGAEGLDAIPNEHLLIADSNDSEHWVRHLVRLTESPVKRERLISSAFDFVRARYDWETIDQKLKTIYAGWLRGQS